MSSEILDPPAAPDVAGESRSPAAPGLRPEARDLLERFAVALRGRPGFTVGEGALAFENQVGETTISLRPVDLPTVDGYRVTEMAEVRTVLNPALGEMDETEMAWFNTYAALGALLHEPGSERPVIVSRTALLAGNDAMLGRYAWLLLASVLAHPEQLIAALMVAHHGGVDPLRAHARRPAAEPCPWEDGEFERLVSQMRERGYYSNGGEGGLVAELPWEPDEVSVVAGHRGTSLLTFSVEDPHPHFGDGLLVRLQLPLPFAPQDRQVAVVHALNRLESEAIDGPPLFGAWCMVPRTPRVAFTAFLPDVMHQPGLAGSVVAWFVQRHRLAREAIGNGRV